jgi:hypothetical protein
MLMSDKYQAPSFYTGGKTVAIGETDIWNEVFAEEIDWRNGWKSYWDYAADNFSDGTDYDSQVPKVELQIFHESGHKSNIATALPPNYKPISMQSMAIASMVLNACEQHGPAVAFVADTVCSSTTPNARPTVTILCESPFGGLETAQQLHGMLMSEHQRCIRDMQRNQKQYGRSSEGSVSSRALRDIQYQLLEY